MGYSYQILNEHGESIDKAESSEILTKILATCTTFPRARSHLRTPVYMLIVVLDMYVWHRQQLILKVIVYLHEWSLVGILL